MAFRHALGRPNIRIPRCIGGSYLTRDRARSLLWGDWREDAENEGENLAGIEAQERMDIDHRGQRCHEGMSTRNSRRGGNGEGSRERSCHTAFG